MTLTPLIPDPNHSIEEPDIPLSRHYTVILELMLARYAHLMDKSLRKTVAYIGKELEGLNKITNPVPIIHHFRIFSIIILALIEIYLI